MSAKDEFILRWAPQIGEGRGDFKKQLEEVVLEASERYRTALVKTARVFENEPHFDHRYSDMILKMYLAAEAAGFRFEVMKRTDEGRGPILFMEELSFAEAVKHVAMAQKHGGDFFLRLQG